MRRGENRIIAPSSDSKEIPFISKPHLMISEIFVYCNDDPLEELDQWRLKGYENCMKEKLNITADPWYGE